MNIFDLKKKSIIITGSAGYLGNQHSEAILEHNGKVILIDSNKKKLIQQKTSLEKKYKTTIKIFHADITNEENINAIYKKLKDNKIYGLINNAAINPIVSKNKTKFSNFENLEYSQWKKEIDVGLNGSFLCSKYFGKIISKNKLNGVILNISSDLGIISPDQNLYNEKYNDFKVAKPASYTVVKSGIIGLTKYLASYWGNKNLRCNCLCFGGMKKDQSKKFNNRIIKKIPLGRMANKNEYKGTIIFLLSDASSYMNGSTIVVDGGRTIL